MSNTEWGIITGTLIMTDLIQLSLDLLFGIGAVINPLIDVFIGMSLPFYLHLRGQNITSGKKIGGLLGTFVLESIPFVSSLPLWSADGIYYWYLWRKETKEKTEQENKQQKTIKNK